MFAVPLGRRTILRPLWRRHNDVSSTWEIAGLQSLHVQVTRVYDWIESGAMQASRVAWVVGTAEKVYGEVTHG